MKKIAMLGTGLIGTFYTMSLHGLRSRDKVVNVFSRSEERVKKFASDYNIAKWSTNMLEVINDPEVDVVVVGLPNNLHKEAIFAACDAGKAVLCTKPLARNADEAWEILQKVRETGVFHGYLEDLVYTPKHLKAHASVENGAIGKVLWVRSREAHPGPHSDWFWTPDISGGGAILDLGCHCIEIGRSFIGKNIRPVEVVCWADTQVKPIAAEDHAIGLVRYANGAIGQFEVSWCFRGGMELKDEVAGVDGSIRMDNFLRTGFEMFSAPGKKGYVAEKAETETGWIFPVGDEVHELGYNDMFADMFNAMENDKKPLEDFYDGYVVNAVMDACYKSAKTKKWEAVELKEWNGLEDVEPLTAFVDYDKDHYLVKEEVLPDGRKKVILKVKTSGEIIQKVTNV
ncbi:MAG: Gfo/Idh/MocA family oxidoreductase [Prolixibacteraceae bacterium]|nr:Gfo/Idh/MocA family oxidoreductase [Prolixibacteraceae bacterium]MBN2774968.1 Gfo/Idh/MocA family oxidoreductase [Prolixibacteraceae bacterium]